MSDRNIPDKCWQPKYGNDSRKWIFNYESHPSDVKPTSAMKEQFRPPTIYESDRFDIARRRELVRSKVVAEIMAEIEDEQKPKEEIIEYCTSYEEQFNTIPGFVLKEEEGVSETENEMFLKYPLYESPPMTIWTDILNKTTKETTKIAGMTKIAEPLSAFKRNSRFTQPVQLRMDSAEI